MRARFLLTATKFACRSWRCTITHPVLGRETVMTVRRPFELAERWTATRLPPVDTATVIQSRDRATTRRSPVRLR